MLPSAIFVMGPLTANLGVVSELNVLFRWTWTSSVELLGSTETWIFSYFQMMFKIAVFKSTISFEMARNPRYFVTHMATHPLLLVLELCSFAVPADGGERTGFKSKKK